MKLYSVYSLKVIKVGTGNNVRYLICKFNDLNETYTEVLTKEKIKKVDVIEEKPLANYYSILACQNYTTGQPLKLDKKALLFKYLEINSDLPLEKNVEVFEEENKNPISLDWLLEKATADFFPKSGVWSDHCFNNPDRLGKENLPCHLRDYNWLAQLLKQEKELYFISNKKILNFVKTSPYFEEKRHEYEQEIVKWQIQFIMNHGENWICDEEYGGDFVYLSPLVDLGVRKGVVDTLLKIGMDRDAIEEGLEKNASLWREQCMRNAFRNEYNSIFDTCLFLCNTDEGVTNSNKDKIQSLEAPDPEHMEKWIKMRKYEYYQRHKKSVDKYGQVESEMVMTKEEAVALKLYLDEKHIERKNRIKEYKEQRTSANVRRLKK